MFNDLVLLHKKTSDSATGNTIGTLASSLASSVAGASGAGSSFEQLTSSQSWFYLPTCLRQIAVGPSSQLDVSHFEQSQIEVYEGPQAYRFMLEVICGLKSPLVGETEIFGQFKTAATQFEATAEFGSAPLKRFLKALNEDAKKVRELHLKDLGSQSYGSLVRRQLKGIKEIHIVGAGQLTKDLLPWLRKDGAEIHIHARDLKRAKQSLEAFSFVKFHSLTERVGQHGASGFQGALIIAAPVEGAWLTKWAQESFSALTVAIDLRGDSHLDCAKLNAQKIVLLNELFERISATQSILQERKDRALKEISQAVVIREQHVEYRPFGWEDVCA